MQVPLVQLQCGFNSYDWGKKGPESAVAKFAAATPGNDFSIQSDKPYAELWMGTHPSNPSKDIATGRTLQDLCEHNQLFLSPSIAHKFGAQLPFLFKVLSIGKALSIQAHPNKKLAEQLHARDPKHYPDDNHKPEMAIAITPFEGLCGFRPLPEIAHFLDTIPPLRALVGEDRSAELVKVAKKSGAENATAEQVAEQKQALRAAFEALMSSAPSAIEAQAEKLLQAADTQGDDFAGGGVDSTSGATLAGLVVRLNRDFPRDSGLFVQFFLNHVRLSPGEAIFLRADDVHAYLSGDIVECMAASDNVVRAGLTPKFKDVNTLVSMLTYDTAPIESQKLEVSEYPYVTLNRRAYSSGSSVALYDPPIEEFSVARAALKGDGAKATFEPLEGPSVIICTAGKGRVSVGSTEMAVLPGYVFFVGSTAELVLEAEGTEDDEFITFKAFCELETPAEAA